VTEKSKKTGTDTEKGKMLAYVKISLDEAGTGISNNVILVSLTSFLSYFPTCVVFISRDHLVIW
jgi:hypothetical protein